MLSLSPSSEEEQHRFQAEETTPMEPQDEVPDSLWLRHFEIWARTKRHFLNEIHRNFKRMQDELFRTDLDWPEVMNLSVPLAGEELLEQQERERGLLELFNIRVSLESFHLFFTSFYQGAEKDIQSFLQSLHRQLLQVFLAVPMPSGPIPAGDPREVNLSRLGQLAVPVVPKVVRAALNVLLEGEVQGEKEEAASAEIGQLLVESVAPYFSHYVAESHAFLQGICSAVAHLMFRIMSRRFERHCEFFEEMEDGERRSPANRDLFQRRPTDSSSQAYVQLSTSDQAEDGFPEGTGTSLEAVLPEEEEEDQQGLTEAFPQAPLNEDVVTVSEEMSEETSIVQAATSVTRSPDERREDLQPPATSGQNPFEDSTSEAAENQPVEERREASLEVPATPNNETEDTNISEDHELEIPQQQGDLELEDYQRRKKKKGVRAFFRRVWKSVASCCCCCCCCCPSDE